MPRSRPKAKRRSTAHDPGAAAGLIQRLEDMFAVILTHVRQDPEFASRIEAALHVEPRPPVDRPTRARKPAKPVARVASDEPPTSAEPPAQPGAPAEPAEPAAPAAPAPPAQRRPAELDPFAAYDQGWEIVLRQRLERLDGEQLADVVHQYDLDPRGHLNDEKRVDRLREWIVRQVLARDKTS